MLAVSGAAPSLPGYAGPAALAAIPRYAAALRRLGGQTTPPYDPLRMAAALGVAVHAVPTGAGTRGLLAPAPGGRYHILVRATDTPAGRRFTVAHELMELGLQRGCPRLTDRSMGSAAARWAKERYCEAGAAEILLPLARTRAEVAAHDGGIAALLPLATLFGASLHATLRRLIETAHAPCLGLILHADQDGSDDGLPPFWPTVCGTSGAAEPLPRLRVRAAWSGGGLCLTAPLGAAVDAHSALTRCYHAGMRLSVVEEVALGRLHGPWLVEAVCPGRGAGRHVYALLSPRPGL